MSKIAILITDLFEDIEYTKPSSSFKDAGHDLVHLGLKENSSVKGKKQGTDVTIEASLDTVSINDFDALFIPGGYSPDKLRAHKPAVDFVKEFVESGKPVFLICHAPQLLITADILKDRKITGWKSIVQDIKNAGAEFVDDEVVVDDNIISSRSPEDLDAFVNISLKKLERKE